ncbi:MAG TPA: 2-oxoglutarate dehydrogenase E1 component [Vicinamibacterales bacterium]|nr:2-oxoglutarate dehydrogenase E1 component [Vicinamibacterales bacterium]
MTNWQGVTGVNRAYVLELYDRYLKDPNAVDAETRALFSTWTPPADTDQPPAGVVAGEATLQRAVGAVKLAHSIRRYGHLAANLDPLGSTPLGDPSLDGATHGVTDDDLRALPATLISSPLADGAANMLEVVNRFRAVYCSTSGHDYNHVFVPEERKWLRAVVEQRRFRAPASPIDPVAVLDRLTQVEAFERFLHRAFQAKTRFSIEGLDMTVPILDEIIGEAAEAGASSMFIGMAHRGRLNIMAHVLNKPYAQILAEFKDPLNKNHFREDMSWTGDVKYHAGAHRAISNGREMRMVVAMPPNPSHLEAVDPVVVGMARAAGTTTDHAGPPAFDPTRSVPVLIHGDSAFPGQGIVAETLNLARLAGYNTGGTIHIIVNNQLGFTAVSRESYSTSYASGLARGFKVPVLHVNADDPEACVEAARLAMAYRNTFQRDFLIDLIGYRRHGHNEGDEPAFTQPLMYQRIAAHPTVREIFARALVARGLVTDAQAEAMNRTYLDELQRVLDGLKPEEDFVEPIPPAPPSGAAAKAKTGVPLERLSQLNASLLALPEGFSVHKKLVRGREKRAQMFAQPAERTVDWAAAEDLAYASILSDGVSIRLTGEDVERGTFSHRHAVLHEPTTGAVFTPLQSIPQATAAFEIHNTPLTELATIGFEFGYSVQEPSRLVIWEAQYGDFINGAQMILDEFVLSARSKWGQRPSLVLLLPHAHEGAGPEHSSARPERFLQLCADINMRVANCTSAAQYFHLLRRQASLLLVDPLPLIVLTPKSLLRHPLVASAPIELAEGRFQRLIDDREAQARVPDVRRVLLCTGKIAIDLLTSDKRAAATHVAVCRLEQLYPINEKDLRGLLDGYSAADEIVWIQEEPENMGYWEFVRPYLERAANGRPVRLIARPRSASPAEGSSARHAYQQQLLIDSALAALPAAPKGRARASTPQAENVAG